MKKSTIKSYDELPLFLKLRFDDILYREDRVFQIAVPALAVVIRHRRRFRLDQTLAFQHLNVLHHRAFGHTDCVADRRVARMACVRRPVFAIHEIGIDENLAAG